MFTISLVHKAIKELEKHLTFAKIIYLLKSLIWAIAIVHNLPLSCNIKGIFKMKKFKSEYPYMQKKSFYNALGFSPIHIPPSIVCCTPLMDSFIGTGDLSVSWISNFESKLKNKTFISSSANLEPVIITLFGTSWC